MPDVAPMTSTTVEALMGDMAVRGDERTRSNFGSIVPRFDFLVSRSPALVARDGMIVREVTGL